MLASQSFITSVVVGKDIVPRIGLHQLEMLRHQLVETLHTSKSPKVRALREKNSIILTKLRLIWPDNILPVTLLLAP